jgi:hypothetical protein
VNGVVSRFLAGLTGVKRYHPTRFEKVCLLVEEVIKAEGDAEWEK